LLADAAIVAARNLLYTFGAKVLVTAGAFKLAYRMMIPASHITSPPLKDEKAADISICISSEGLARC
jgi:hypothetical protein